MAAMRINRFMESPVKQEKTGCRLALTASTLIAEWLAVAQTSHPYHPMALKGRFTGHHHCLIAF